MKTKRAFGDADPLDSEARVAMQKKKLRFEAIPNCAFAVWNQSKNTVCGYASQDRRRQNRRAITLQPPPDDPQPVYGLNGRAWRGAQSGVIRQSADATQLGSVQSPCG